MRASSGVRFKSWYMLPVECEMYPVELVEFVQAGIDTVVIKNDSGDG